MKTGRATCFVLSLLSLACVPKSQPVSQAQRTLDSSRSAGTSALEAGAARSPDNLRPDGSARNSGKLVVVAHFTDGSQLHGTPECETVSVHTPYANLDLQWKDLSSIEFGPEPQSLRISFRNGDKLQGTLNAEMCQLQTLVGAITMDPKNLVSIQITVQPSVPETDLFAYYPLDGDANDLSGNHNDGIATGLSPTANRLGVPNTAVYFDGVHSSISVPSNQSMHPDDQLTATFWVRVDGLINYSPIFHKGGLLNGDFVNREYTAYIKSTGPDVFQFQFFSAGDGRGQHGVLSNGNYPIRQWLFVATVFDRKHHMISLYINDSLEARTGDSYSSFNPNNFPLTIGVEAENTFAEHSPLVGAIDELRLYKRALTRGEIHALYVSQ